MSKTRQRLPDGSVIVRTYPVTFLHDHTERRRDPDWHQLIYATRGQLEVITDDMRRIVPADRAVWIPAGTQHTELMRAPISMRSLFVARGAVRGAAATVRTIAVTPLLRELVLHISRIGALDRNVRAQARLVGVLLDLLAIAEDVRLELAAPRDARARKLADLITAKPGDPRSLGELARACGASLRTLERCFLVETGVALGDWRRRVRLFHALRRLEAGTAVTEVAFEVGYSSVSAFSHAFTRELGHAPTRRPRPR